MKKQYLIQGVMVGLYLSGLNAFAQELYYCSNTGAYIALGSSEAAVEHACGTPTTKEDRKEVATTTQPIAQYFYERSRASGFIEDRLQGGGGLGYDDGFAGYGEQLLGDSRTDRNARINLTFTVADDQITGIRLAGEAVESTSLCSASQQLKVGDPASTIIYSCGEPGFVNHTTETQRVGIRQVMVWTYEGNPYSSPAIFKFTDGILTDVS